MTTLAEVRAVAQKARGSLASYCNCGAISPQLAGALRTQLGVDARVIEGSLSRYELRGHGPEHAFVRIPKADVSDATRDVIVDGTLDQFCDENKRDGRVWFSLGPRASFNSVEVLAPSTESGWSSRDRQLYEAYSDAPPV